MRLPSRSFGDLILLRLTVMKPCRNMRDGKTAMAVSADAPAPTWLISSEDENSQQSNSSRPAMRSKMSRGLAIGMKFRSIPAGFTSPVSSGTMRSYAAQENESGRAGIQRAPNSNSGSNSVSIPVQFSVEARLIQLFASRMDLKRMRANVRDCDLSSKASSRCDNVGNIAAHFTRWDANDIVE